MKIKKYIKKNKFVFGFCLLLVGFSFFLMLFFSKESDYFWHIKAGEYMVKNKSILTSDIFSWYMLGKYWMSHEWLFEVVLYVFKLLFGKFHMVVYSFFGICLLLFILFFCNKKAYLKNIPFSLFWICLSLILFVFIQARPHILSFSLLALTIYVLYDLFLNEDSKKIYFLPLVTIFWANLHGGSSNLSYLFCLLFIVGGLFKFKYSKIEAKRISCKQLKKYLIVMILCMICTCINPHGIKMFFYPYSNMADTLMVSNISEWRPTVLSEIGHYPYFLLLIIIIMILLFSRRRIQFIDLLLLGVVCFLGLKSIRFWAYTYIVFSFIIFNYIGERKYDKGSFGVVCLLGLSLIGIFVVNINCVVKECKKTYINENLISIIKVIKPKRFYNMYDYGGELIYNDISVFIDGRADLYSKYNYKDYLDISKLNGDYVKLIDKYDFDCFLVDKKYPINTYLKYNTTYEKIYSDKNMVLYKKKD